MPYIKADRRRAILLSSALKEEYLRSSGELNYLITWVAKEYLYNHGESYQTYNDIMGALEGAKLELYRRKIAGYEKLKIEENGDVY